jgi:hypothetical protein
MFQADDNHTKSERKQSCRLAALVSYKLREKMIKIVNSKEICTESVYYHETN